MKTETKCQPAQTNTGLSVKEALDLHAGWDAAMRGEPVDMGRGSLWVEGWINFWWLRDDGNRSWKRH